MALPVCLPTRPVCGYAPWPRPKPQHEEKSMVKKFTEHGIGPGFEPATLKLIIGLVLGI